MATKDVDEGGDARLNVDAVVGVGSTPDYLDMIVVQGLMAYIYQFGFTKWTNVKPREPGDQDYKVLNTCIRNYQNYIRSHPQYYGVWVAGDGRVSPAPYGKGSCGPKQVYTISSLNGSAGVIWAANPDQSVFADYVDAVCTFYPLVGYAVMYTPPPLVDPIGPVLGGRAR